MNVTRSLFCAALAAVAVFGQTSPARPEFEVASIKPSATAVQDRVQVGLHIDGAQFHIEFPFVEDYIATAYRLREYQVSGPEWLASERFDIDAKLPAGARQDQVPEDAASVARGAFRDEAAP